MELMEGLIGNWMTKRGQITLFNIVVCYERNNTIQKKKETTPNTPIEYVDLHPFKNHL